MRRDGERGFIALRVAVLRAILREVHCVSLLGGGRRGGRSNPDRFRCPRCKRDTARPLKSSWAPPGLAPLGGYSHWACSCGAHGDAIDLLALREGLDWQAATALALSLAGHVEDELGGIDGRAQA